MHVVVGTFPLDLTLHWSGEIDFTILFLFDLKTMSFAQILHVNVSNPGRSLILHLCRKPH